MKKVIKHMLRITNFKYFLKLLQCKVISTLNKSKLNDLNIPFAFADTKLYQHTIVVMNFTSCFAMKTTLLIRVYLCQKILGFIRFWTNIDRNLLEKPQQVLIITTTTK